MNSLTETWAVWPNNRSERRCEGIYHKSVRVLNNEKVYIVKRCVCVGKGVCFPRNSRPCHAKLCCAETQPSVGFRSGLDRGAGMP